MSPLTTSYFSCWSFFDACAGPTNETIGSVLLEFCGRFDIGNELSRLIRIMQRSRMGFYINKGREGDLLILEELVTGTVCTAMVPAGDLASRVSCGMSASSHLHSAAVRRTSYLRLHTLC
ncbi:MAG: hypothetical protein WKF37_22740 [Bryobacteraceae bacterium]